LPHEGRQKIKLTASNQMLAEARKGL